MAKYNPDIEITPEMITAAAKIMSGYLWHDYGMTADDCAPIAEKVLAGALGRNVVMSNRAPAAPLPQADWRSFCRTGEELC